MRIAKWSAIGLAFITILSFAVATIYPRLFRVPGFAFERGLGWANQDGKTAAFWYGLGARFGDSLSQERFEYLSKTITRENIDDASKSDDTPDAILFSKLDAQDAQQVVAELKRLNIAAHPSESSQSIRVPASRVYCLRIDLAAIGLPSKGPVGLGPMEFIRFSDQTEFIKHVRLYRNVEREIAKSVSCLPSVKSAVVHLSLIHI